MRYVNLVPEEVALKAFNYFPDLKCSEASFKAIIETLSEKIGEPYSFIPSSILAYGKAGIYGWCGVCGAFNGTSAAVSVIFEGNDKKVKAVLNHLANFLLSNVQPVFLPGNVDSILRISLPSLSCSDIFLRFHKEHGVDFEDDRRKKFCRCLTYTTVFKTVEILNRSFYQA
ncbi:C-GCAxxG-C-C family (seleno)protein [Desulfurobacterium atlanticum]|uniref:Putative redox-active protein (C_GCAxxG_C_C) n=1 Tax=Desulfurobacterium atlanticum TaxID=240169 RepID=A0A238XV17_9BACT|nr:C-GCAxxG-C-C family (seleno)protein [Desulfurobacterium atlanticum]SNR62398.1 Putative redox-active protein (C_GCAxxG_C_C) [Desulfurobacterium atlanticum]